MVTFFMALCALVGGVHDYLSGMISMRENGKSIAEVVGKELGPQVLTVMRFISIILMVLVGAAFTTGPAMLLAKLTGWTVLPWVIVLVGYYCIVTLLPLDAVIARFYPILGVSLVIMAVGILFGLLNDAGGHVAHAG